MTSLSEISSRLEKLYSIKLGKDKVKLILESAKVGLVKYFIHVIYCHLIKFHQHTSHKSSVIPVKYLEFSAFYKEC